jgi:hypothetical protein
VVCLPLLALSAAYAYVALFRGITRRAVPFFVLSYPIVGVTLDYYESLIWKRFAPSDATLGRYLEAYSAIAVVTGLAAFLVWSSYRAATSAAK